MPDDSIMDMVNNVEELYIQKIRLFDRWVKQGDAWTERMARRNALFLARQFAEALRDSDMVEGRYVRKDFQEAANEMLAEFQQYREEAIKAIVQREAHVPTPEELKMDEGDIAHAKKYEELAQKLGIDNLRPLIPASADKIRKAIDKGDKYLNSIPLYRWDAAAEMIRVPGLSLGEKVCVLKHVATWHYA